MGRVNCRPKSVTRRAHCPAQGLGTTCPYSPAAKSAGDTSPSRVFQLDFWSPRGLLSKRLSSRGRPGRSAGFRSLSQCGSAPSFFKCSWEPLFRDLTMAELCADSINITCYKYPLGVRHLLRSDIHLAENSKFRFCFIPIYNYR